MMADEVRRRRSFPEAFKWEAAAAVRAGRSVSQVAAELGLPDRLVRSWLRWAEWRTPATSGAPARRVGPSPADQAAEIARLRRENERLRMERDILLVVPDLEAGNMLAKQLTFLAGADAAGVVLGARVPIVLTSRADGRRTRIASCAVAVFMARARRASPGAALG